MSPKKTKRPHERIALGVCRAIAITPRRRAKLIKEARTRTERRAARFV